MKGQTKAKLIVFFIVAIIAFAASSMAANIILIKNPNFQKNLVPKILNPVKSCLMIWRNNIAGNILKTHV